ncbi:MAG: hypothetical protein IJA10_02635 [Lachnospiraceae bacterium]|nr:hypothetical protein [Lachnospiraceae bacterium]
MTYKYQKISEEEEESLRGKYEIALNLVEMIQNEWMKVEDVILFPFFNVDFYKFDEMVVRDEEKKVCLMKSGYHSEKPEYKFRIEFSYALFLFIEEEIILIDMNDYGGWVEIDGIFVPSSLAEQEEEIKKIVEDSYTVWFYSSQKMPELEISFHYNNQMGYVVYDEGSKE